MRTTSSLNLSCAAVSAAKIMLFILALVLNGPVHAQDYGRQLATDGIVVTYPPDWTATSYGAMNLLTKRPMGANKLPSDPAVLAQLPQMTVSTEERRNHSQALRRLRELSGWGTVDAEVLQIGGWPAIQLHYETARQYSDRGEAVGSETVLVVRTVVAVGNILLRLEARLPPDASEELIAEVRAIGTDLVFDTRGDPEAVDSEIRRLERFLESPPKTPDMSVVTRRPATMASKSDIDAGIASRGAVPLLSVTTALEAESGGATVPVSSEGFPDAELEIAVSNSGRDIVIGSNGTWYYSDDAGQTWNPTSTASNDPSVAWGQSGGPQGTFYAANISLGTSSTIIEKSTDGGATWTAPAPAYTCTQNGDPDCTTSVGGVTFPDQEHIAVDRWNVTAGGDQVYSASRIGFPNYWGLVCSTDSANTWSANSYISNQGDLPRITVGADGFVYVVYIDSGNIMLDKFQSCENQSDPMDNELFFPVTVRANFVDVACPMPGLNRCNNGNRLTSPVVAVDDTDSNHIYVSYANNTNPGDGSNCTDQNLCDEDIIVQDSLDGGSSWPASYPSDFCAGGFCFDSGAVCSANSDCFEPDRIVTISSGVTARRFMPWVCSVGGEAYVSWYDRRAAFPGGTTVSNNSLTDYYMAKAFLDTNGALAAGPELQVNDLGTADPQCEGGFPTGSAGSWPNGTRAMNDSESCSVQPQLGGTCCLPADVTGSGRCSQAQNPANSSLNACDFSDTPGAGMPPCQATETCVLNTGFPKYGDYNGNACGVGRVHLTWASGVAPLAFPPTNDIDSFFSSKVVCCVPQIQVPGDVDFGQVCGLEEHEAELNVCNTGKENLEVVSITSDDAQFAVTPPLAGWPVVISPDFCFPFEVTYNPDGTGADAGILTVNSNDPVNPALQVPVSGSVGEPDLNVAIADAGDFGAVCKGDQADLDLTLFNQGECDLIISSITSDNPLFDLPDDTQYDLKLSPDAEFTLPIRYAPLVCNDAGDDGTITIESDSPGEETLEIDVSGVAPCPNLVIDPDALTEDFAFPATVVDETGTLGCFSERSTVIRNTGACPLTISAIAATGLDFTVMAPTLFPIELPPGEETLEVVVRFTPQDDGMPLTADEITGLLTVTSDDPDASGEADLCGEGVIQSGVRILVTDITSGEPVIVDSVDAMTVKSKGKSIPGPINLQYMDVTPVLTTVCGNEVNYHLNIETLPAVDTTGANGQSEYIASAKEGNLADNRSFTLDQCEFSEFQLQLKSSDGGEGEICLLLAKGESCTSAEQCCSGRCKGPDGGKTCK